MSSSEWWKGCVVYQIYPRSFVDSNGDGVGDLPGIMDKLDYVAALGVDAIWISPFFRSPMKDFGYDISDYCDVDPIFGNQDDFQRLVIRAHELGLKVIIDQVWGHTSDHHDWFKESRRDRHNHRKDWYVWADPKPDGTAPNNWLSYFGGPAWTWDTRREQYYLHHFLKDQPNLNLWNPDVRAAIKETARFWLDMGVDGFRLDAIHTFLADQALRDNPACAPGTTTDITSNNPMARQNRIYTTNLPENLAWIEEIRDFVGTDKCLLAEVGGDDSEKAAAMYVQTGKRCHFAYSFGLVGTKITKSDLVKAVTKVEGLIEDGWFCWAVSNHDYKRVASRLIGDAPAEAKALFGSVLGLCLRGSFCLYQGEELGLPQAELAYEDLQDPYDKMLYPEHVGRDGCRTPIPWVSDAIHGGFSSGAKPWLPVSPAHLPLAVDEQLKNENSNLHRMRRFLKWRKASPAIVDGAFHFIETPGDIFAFRREKDGKATLCVFNCSATPGTVSKTVLGRAGPLLQEVSYSAKENDDTLGFGPFGYAFLSI